MKRSSRLTLLVLLQAGLLAPLSWAGSVQRPLAIGAMIGAPTGLTAKLWTTPDRALDFGLAYSLNQSLLLQAHSLNHLPTLGGSFAGVRSTQDPVASSVFNKTRPYWGWGATVHFRGFEKNKDQAGLGARFPLGLEWNPHRFSFFAEIAPGIGLLPSTVGFLEGSLGARYLLP